jgi:histidinol-phosphate aminotransferase
MEFVFRPQLKREIKSYALNTPDLTGILDCSLGVNPYGCPEECYEAAKNFNYGLLSSYPHSHALRDAIVDYWKDFAKIDKNNVFGGNGSMGVIYALINIFSQSERKEVVGFIPCFQDVVESITNYGLTYIGVPFRASENGRQEPEDLIAKISDKTAFVYIDRPNNPTGQTLPLTEVAKICEAARAKGAYVFMDEAYGDFIEKNEASICLLDRFDNLVVFKTISKGFGLANLRCGYVVSNPEIISYCVKTQDPYCWSDIGSEVGAVALKAEGYTTSHAADFAEAKAKIRCLMGDKLEMLVTDDRVPICTLKLKKGGDLQAELLKNGVLAVSGREFEGIDESCVRLRVSSAENLPKILDAVRNL